MLASPHFIWITGFRKNVEAAAKQKGCEIIGNWQRSIINHLYWCLSSKGCEIIGNWQRSIINHLYWCVSSTPEGDSETVLAKWLCLWESRSSWTQTQGQEVSQVCTQQVDRKKKWFTQQKCYILYHSYPLHSCCYYYTDSKPSEKLTDLLMNSQLCKDITRLSPVHQTSSLVRSIPQCNSTLCSQVCMFPFLSMEWVVGKLLGQQNEVSVKNGKSIIVVAIVLSVD